MNKEIIEKVLLEISTPTGLTYSGDTTICNDEVKDIMNYINNLEQQVKKQKEVIDKVVKYIDDLRDESAERQGFYNCFPDDLYIPDINELLDILKDKEVSE